MVVIFTLLEKKISKGNLNFSYPRKYCDFQYFLSENWNMLLPLNGML